MSFKNHIHVWLQKGLHHPLVERIKDNRQRIVTFLVFLLLSASFWFLSVLNERYTTEILYPVRFVNFPQENAQIANLPEYLELRIESHGFKLLGYHTTTSVNPIMVDLNLFTLDSSGRDVLLSIASSRLLPSVSQQLSDEVNLLAINPDSIHLQYLPSVQRKVPIQLGFDFEIPRQHLLKGITLEPDSVLVRGLSNRMDTLRAIYTENKKIRKLISGEVYRFELSLPSELSSPVEEVSVSFDFEEFTQSSLALPISVKNLPEGFSISLFPEEVTLSYLVALSDFDKVQAYQFRVEADYSLRDDAEWNEKPRLKLFLTKQPSFIHSTQMSPQWVDYILEKHD